MIKERVKFKTKSKITLKGVIYKPSQEKQHHGIIICDGFKSIGLDSIKLARELCNRGFIVMRFHYSDSWWSKSLFENMTITKELAEIRSAVQFFRKHNQIREVGLIGRSLGATNAFLYGSIYQGVKALVCLSIIVDLKKTLRSYFSKDELKSYMKKGFMIFKIPTNFIFSIIRFKVKTEALIDAEKYQMGKYLSKLKCPTLFIHGEKDNRSLPRDLAKFYKRLKCPKKIKYMKKGGHVYLFMKNKEEIHNLAASWFSKYFK